MTKVSAEYSREWRVKNPGKAAEHNRRYREKHPDRVKIQRAKERALYVKKGRYTVSDEHKRQVDRRNEKLWRDKNPDRVKAKARRSYLKNKAVHMLHGRNYKAKKRAGRVGTVTRKDLESILASQKGTCPLCKRGLSDPKEIDHKLPISKGGEHSVQNIQWVHRWCNRSKGNKICSTEI